VIFPDNRAAAASQTRTPVLGWFRLLELVQLPDFLESFVDKLPGTRACGVHFAVVFSGAAARAIQHVFGTAGDGTNPAVLVEHTRATGCAFLRPDSSFLQDADERRVQTGINRFAGVTLRQGLNTGTATQGKNGIVVLDGIGRLLEKDVVALAFDRRFFDFKREAF